LQNDLIKTKLSIESASKNRKTNFASTLYLSNASSTAKKKCVAEICLPCDKSMAKTVDLNLNYDEIKELLKHI
jgi:hypothetical protein